ncbi:Crp/Fnr family transcriptional regulator [Phenylobacterium sp.]|uniref:Crp/Fnr family transcriptional regulator n=1 Tax=Phenylobacterium sp. TaxID=1871053 RepID=UPI003983042D
MDLNNRFLDDLSAEDLRRLRPHLHTVELARGQVLDEPETRVSGVYLPVNCIISVITVMNNGAQVETRTIGCEGGYGLLHALGSPVAYERMEVQLEGRAWRLALAALAAAAADSRSLTDAIVRDGQATILQATQSVACNVLHSAEQRLCRWMLLTHDRVRDDVLPLTQEQLATKLGVQRTTVTAVASQLQARGLISYSRGKIRVLDRPAIERCACECYAAIQRGVAMIVD